MPRLPRRTLAGPAVLLAASGALALVGPAHAAGALVAPGSVRATTEDQTYPLPASGSVSFEGHGYGSGVGMAQWGAEGAAEDGLSWQRIVAFYYPHTTLATVANATVRVLLSAAAPQLSVEPVSGLVATNAADGAHLDLPTANVAKVRAHPVSGGVQVQQLAAGAGAVWRTDRFSDGATSVAGPVSFAAAGQQLELLTGPGLAGEMYRGALEAVAGSATSVETIDALPLESYLYGVVPHEAISSWRPAALEAQAVAARSYALYRRAERRAAGLAWDVTDTTADQVFDGPASVASTGARTVLDAASTTAAVNATVHEVLEQGGSPIAAEYGSSDGGWTVEDPYVDYLPAEADPYDGVPGESVHTWTVPVPVSTVAAAAGLAHVSALVVTTRDGHGAWGGRVLGLEADGTTSSGASTTKVLDPAAFTGDLGLLDTWWTVLTSDASAVGAVSKAPGLHTAPGPDTAVLSATFADIGTTSWPLSRLRLVAAAGSGRQPAVTTAAVPAPADLTRPSATTAQRGDRVRVWVAVSAATLPAGTYPSRYQLRLSGTRFGASAPFSVTVVATTPGATATPARRGAANSP